VGADSLDDDMTARKEHGNDQAIVVAFDVEDYPVLAQKAGGGIAVTDVLRCLLRRLGCLGQPGFQRTTGLAVACPEFHQLIAACNLKRHSLPLCTEAFERSGLVPARLYPLGEAGGVGVSVGLKDLRGSLPRRVRASREDLGEGCRRTPIPRPRELTAGRGCRRFPRARKFGFAKPPNHR